MRTIVCRKRGTAGIVRLERPSSSGLDRPMGGVSVSREGCLPPAGEGMQKTIARIRPLAPAFAAVAASVLVSLVVLRPPAERLLPGAAPADRGHVGALVLPAPRVSRPAARPQPVLSPAAPINNFVPTHRALRPPAAAASPVHPKPSPKPAPKPKPKPAAPTPPAPPAAPATPPAPPQPVALARHGHGPPAHSHSRLLAAPKPEPAHGPPPGKPPSKPPHHGPPPGKSPGHGKPKPPPPAPAPVQPPPPHGHAGAPPGQEKEKGSPHH